MIFWARCFFLVRSYCMHYRMFKNILSLCLLDASTEPPPQVGTIKNTYRYWQHPLGRGQKNSLLRTMELEVAPQFSEPVSEHKQPSRTGCFQKEGYGTGEKHRRPEGTTHGGDQRQRPDQHNTWKDQLDPTEPP